jgi:hypothetical protein
MSCPALAAVKSHDSESLPEASTLEESKPIVAHICNVFMKRTSSKSTSRIPGDQWLSSAI